MTEENIQLSLLANFVHQVINPLSGVCGTLDNVLHGTVPESKKEQRLKAARAQLEHCIALIKNLAYFTQYPNSPDEYRQAAGLKITVVPQNIIEAAQFFQELASQRGMSINLDDPTTQTKIHANPDLMRQVFMNLFDNAVKYAQKGTTIRVKQWMQKSTGDLIVTVESIGKPIAVGDSEKIFVREFRGVNAREVVASGTGLGLFICKLIVQDFSGGTIRLDSGIGSETTRFEIRIPGAWI